MKKYLIAFLLFAFVKLYCQTYNYPHDISGSFVMNSCRLVIVGDTDYAFTQAYSFFKTNFSSTSSFISSTVTPEKIYNYEVFSNNVPLYYSRLDSVYKIIDSTLLSTGTYTWSYTDLTDSSTIIQFVTSKPMQNVNSINVSTLFSVNRANGISFSHPLISADSIIYFIGTDSITRVRKKIMNTSTGINFSSSELSTLNSSIDGAFLMMIYNIMPQTYNNRKYYFENNSTIIVGPIVIN